ncbi:cytochrome P450 [Acaryochloris sp. CCMEE 5410]|uniref:cytochrome P450 n=1 Tax=Acaryochloris sp. CCMEE 5410 TaxID=310037 RepID=UPI0002484FA9|nr:cytochrome P450 [Acaryochloris sp. CCMEE 5410]KAI9132195.1 cytochrome P450 [Acaryochloris sp. CCMEE 5410]
MPDLEEVPQQGTKRYLPAPPGPPGYLLFKLPSLQKTPIEYLGTLHQEYGDLVRLPIMPGLTLYSAIHPDHAEHILSTYPNRYGKPDFFLKPMGLVQGQGLFTSEGDLWQKHRRLMQPAFQQKKLVYIHTVMLKCVQSLIREWEEKPEGAVIDIAAEMTRLTLQIVSLALFSVDISQESDALGKAFRTALAYVYFRLTSPLAVPVWLPTPRNLKFRQAKQTLNRIVLDIIQSRRYDRTEHYDLLSMLLTAQDAETQTGMSDRQLQDEVITLINAGHETMATALAWTWYILGTHPHILTRIEDEINTELGAEAPSFETLPQLEYTGRVFDESLRLYPPGIGLAPRMALERDELQGYAIPKGAIININSYFTSRHRQYWDDAEQFDPDRFLPDQVHRHKYAYLPFGAGPHVCIGKNFALMEAKTILAAIIQKFRISLVPNQPIEIDPRFTLRPKYGIKVTIHQKTDRYAATG